MVVGASQRAIEGSRSRSQSKTLLYLSAVSLSADSKVRRLQTLAYRVKIRPTDGSPDQPPVLLALSVPRFQVHARVVLMDIDVLARVPVLPQLLAGLIKQRHELALVVERGHDLMPPLVSHRVVCIPAHHPAIDIVIIRIDLRHRTSIAPLPARRSRRGT